MAPSVAAPSRIHNAYKELEIPLLHFPGRVAPMVRVREAVSAACRPRIAGLFVAGGEVS